MEEEEHIQMTKCERRKCDTKGPHEGYWISREMVSHHHPQWGFLIPHPHIARECLDIYHGHVAVTSQPRTNRSIQNENKYFFWPNSSFIHPYAHTLNAYNTHAYCMGQKRDNVQKKQKKSEIYFSSGHNDVHVRRAPLRHSLMPIFNGFSEFPNKRWCRWHMSWSNAFAVWHIQYSFMSIVVESYHFDAVSINNGQRQHFHELIPLRYWID